jgi:hypothetical protein
MDQTKSGLIRKLFIKERAQRFLANFVRPSSCESPSKSKRHLVQLLEIRIIIANAVMKFIAP